LLWEVTDCGVTVERLPNGRVVVPEERQEPGIVILEGAMIYGSFPPKIGDG